LGRRRIPFVRATNHEKITQRNQRKIFAKNCGSNFGIAPPEFFYCVTVITSAAEWLLPEVAVTVILEVPGGVPVFGFGCGLPPLQPTINRANAMTLKTAEQRLALLPRAPVPTIKNPNTRPSDHEVKVQGRRPASGTAAEFAAVVLMVRVVDSGDPLGVRLAGEKVQLDAPGRPLQANDTGELMPFTGLIVMVNTWRFGLL
jgi:hypothetical protein